MAKKKTKGGGADVLFRVGVEAHPATSKVLSDLGKQVTATQQTIASSMRDVSRHATSASDQIKREVELLNRGFGREQLSAFRAARDGAKSAIEATGAAVVGQIRSVFQSATDQMKAFANAPQRSVPQSSVTAANRGTPAASKPGDQYRVPQVQDLPAGGRGPEAETDRVKRILREHEAAYGEHDQKIRAIETGMADHAVAETRRMVDAKKRILAEVYGSQSGRGSLPESPIVQPAPSKPNVPANRVDVVARNDAPTNVPPPSSTAVATKESETDRIKRILRDYGVWTAELDRKIRAIESGQADHGIAETKRMVDAKKRILASLPGSPPAATGQPESPTSRNAPRGRSTRPVVSQAAQDEAGEDRYDNRQREQGILDRIREREREEKDIAKRTAEWKLEWQKRVANAQRAGLVDDSKFMQLSAKEQEVVIKKREGLKKQFYTNQTKMARESAAAEREAAASVSAAQVEAVAKAQAIQNQYTSSRRALMGSLAESTASVMQLARGIGMLGLVGDENMEDFVKGLAKLQGTFDVVVGGMQSIQRLSGVWTNLRSMMDAASAASAIGGTKSTAMTAALAREAVAANAAAAAYMRLNAGRGGGGAAGAAGNAATRFAASAAGRAAASGTASAAGIAAGRFTTGAATGAAGSAVSGEATRGVGNAAIKGAATGVAATAAKSALTGAGAAGTATAAGAATTGAAGAGAAGAGAATGGMTAATIGVPVAAAIAAVASSVLAGIVTKDFAKGISSSGFGGGMKQGSVGDNIATGEVKFMAMLDKMAAKTGLSSEARAGAIDALISPIGKLIPGLNGFGKAITDLTATSARVERAEKARADSKERMLKELEQHRREMDLERQRTEQRDELGFQENDVKRFVANADQEDKQSALDRKIAGEKRSLEHDRNPAEFAARSQKIAGLEKQRRDSGADFLSPEMLEKRTLLIKKQQDALNDLAKIRKQETEDLNSSGNVNADIRNLELKKQSAKGLSDNEKQSLDELTRKRDEADQKIQDAHARAIAAGKDRLAIENEITKAKLAANRAAIADLHREIELRGQIAEMERGRIDNARQKFGQMDVSDQKKLVLAAERVRKEGLEFDRTGMSKADRDKIGAAKTEYTAAQKELAESGDALKTLKTGKGNKFTDAQGELEAAREAQKKLLEKQESEKKDAFGFDKKQSPEAAKEQFAARQAAAKRIKEAQEAVRAASTESPDRKEKIKAAEERHAKAKERMAKAMNSRDMVQFDVAQTSQEKRKRDGEVNAIKAKQQAGMPISGDEQQKLEDAENRRRDAIASGLSREDRNILGSSGLRVGEDIQRRGFDQSARAGGFGRVEDILGGDERARANDADRNKRQLQDEVVARESQNRNTVQEHESRSRPAHDKLAEEISAKVTTKTDVNVTVVTDRDEVLRQIQNALNVNTDRDNQAILAEVSKMLAADKQTRNLQVTQVTASRKAGIPR
jgi:hypothetical protein